MAERDPRWTAFGRRVAEALSQRPQKDWLDVFGLPQSTMSKYYHGKGKPTPWFLGRLALETGVAAMWLLTGLSPKRFVDVMRARMVPVIGEVPAGPPGGAGWDATQGPDLMEMLLPAHDESVIGLIVTGWSMFPTLWKGDYVAMSPQSEGRTGDLVVAEVIDGPDEYSEKYVVKRLGRPRPGKVVLRSDNARQYPAAAFDADRVRIRGKVVGIVRLPDGRRATEGAEVDEELLDYLVSDEARELLRLIHGLTDEQRKRAIRILDDAFPRSGT